MFGVLELATSTARWYNSWGLAFLGGSRPPGPPELTPAAPPGVPRTAPPLLAPEAPGPVGLGGGSPQEGQFPQILLRAVFGGPFIKGSCTCNFGRRSLNDRATAMGSNSSWEDWPFGGGLQPPRPSGPGASGANRGGVAFDPAAARLPGLHTRVCHLGFAWPRSCTAPPV